MCGVRGGVREKEKELEIPFSGSDREGPETSSPYEFPVVKEIVIVVPPQLPDPEPDEE